MTEEEIIALDFHGTFQKDSFDYLKPRPSSHHEPVDKDT